MEREDYRKERTCGQKDPYPDENTARRVARYLDRSGTNKGLMPYRCHYCQAWHLGHSKGRKK